MEGKLLYNAASYGTNETDIGTHNLCRDLSIINRKNHTMTNNKGIPLVYHCKVTVWKPGYASDTDRVDELKFLGVPQNWVYRNAAVKLHQAREHMFKKNGVKKSERGRYSKTIRYTWDQADTWIAPYSSQKGSEYSGDELGTWDSTTLELSTGAGVNVTLWQRDAVALGDEEAGLTAVPLAVAYMNSRQTIREDDQDSTTSPKQYSMIKDLFATGESDDTNDVIALARDEQDNPPYDADDLQGPHYQTVELGRAQLGQNGVNMAEIYIDVPFGLCEARAQARQGQTTTGLFYAIEVLGVSEMQG